jgi:hypothetical protein
LSARLVSSRTNLSEVNRVSRRRTARLLELLFLACALLLGALLAATTLAAAPLHTAHARRRDDDRQPLRLSSPVSRHAPLTVGATPGAK